MADNADERLIVMLEARIAEFERRMIAAERRGTRTYNNLARGSKTATAAMERDAITAAARINAALANVSDQVGTFAKGFAVGILATGLNQVAGAARNAIAEMADLADMAARVGMGVEEVQGLEYGFKLAGISADEAASALEKFTDALGDAAAGQGALAERMAAAGIVLRDSTGQLRPTLDLLREYANAVQAAPNPAAQMAMTTDAFGRGGKAMVLAMQEGASGIDNMIASARAAGVVLDEEMIQKAAELDDRFDEVAAKIDHVFKVATISAAQFFGFIENHQKTMAFDAATAARVIGDEMAAQLAKLPDVSEGARAEIESLLIEYQQLGDEAQRLVPALSDASNMMRGLGKSTVADELSRLVMEVQNAANSFEAGAITGDEFRLKLTDVLTQTNLTISGLDELDRARLDGITGAVAGLFGWISQIPASVSAAQGAISNSDLNGVAIGGSVIDVTSYGNYPRPAPATPARPVSGGRGGGGGGNGRLAALLRDLQTEREALTQWHSESVALINSASDAQLAAIGGRHAAMERLESEHQERMAAIRDISAGGALAKTQSLFGALATVTASGTGRVLQIHKTFAAAETLINTIRAQGQVLADPKLGFWAKLPAVAAIGGAGAALVAALGKGGAVPRAGAASVPAAGGGDTATGAGASPAPPLRFLASGIDPAKLYQGQALIDLVNDIQKELGVRGMVLEFVK